METPMEYECHGVPFLIYSEYVTADPEIYSGMAKNEGKYVIGGAREKDCVSVSMYGPDGGLIGKRNKMHLTPADMEKGAKPGKKIHSFKIDKENIEVLPILCYELLFPEDWINLDAEPDFITHHVGFPMYDKIQDEDWFAMQKALSLGFECDVVVACGDGDKGLNNSSLVSYNKGNPKRTLYKRK